MQVVRYALSRLTKYVRKSASSTTRPLRRDRVQKTISLWHNGHHFLGSEENKQPAVVEAIARAFYAWGKVVSPEAIQLTEADLGPESCGLILVDI